VLEIEKSDVLRPKQFEKQEMEEIKNKFLTIWQTENIS